MTNKKQKLEHLFATLQIKNDCNGAVLVAEKGKVLYQGAFGYADFTTERKLVLDSVFELASLSKPFTAIAMILLQQQGKINYDDLIEQWLPQLPYKGITIRHLLTHTSGLPDYMETLRNHWDHSKIVTNKDVLDMLIKYQLPAVFSPNETFLYSNTGYIILALLVETITGNSFADYMKENVFTPFGMKNTRVYNRRYKEEKIDNYAYGYVYDIASGQYKLPDDVPETDFVVYLDGVQGDGAINSTIGDLFAFDQALYENKIIKPSSLIEAFSPGQLSNNETFDYGFGWILEGHAEKGKMVSHGGGWPGYSTSMTRYIDQQKTIIFLSNRENPVEYDQEIIASVENILFDQPFTVPEREKEKKVAQINKDVYNHYVGTYLIAGEKRATIYTEAGHLYTQIEGQVHFEMYPASETRYFLRHLPVEVEFVRAQEGKVTHFIIYQNNEAIEATRID
ncbi:serine hydrolase [Brevibacillus daliensis]|uniref:serine hydrolase n=1 Tax=Brevibacillus daliensis TaxID=2892995 RepID=UPI001E522B8F|nr:serine hydrolase [Brevibacillus daliensis]